MFTLIRPVAALLMAVFAYYAAKAYEPLYDPQAYMGTFAAWTALMGLLVGWVFVGGRIGRAWWFSIYIGIQGVAMTGVFIAMVMAVREVFILGYRRRFREIMDAFTGYFDIVVNWLGKAVDQDYLIFLATGGAVIGFALHLVWMLLERRRNDR
ncbi:TrgA family protein [Cereibacter sphaeroides]|nr:TrgA family protein [Cereibacter sphaeroides]